MRLKERELTTVEIAARVCARGALGSVIEGFSDERKAVRASILPEDVSFSTGESGLKTGGALRLIIPKDVSVSEGDGLWMDGALYVVASVRRWRAHAELACVRRQ